MHTLFFLSVLGLACIPAYAAVKDYNYLTNPVRVGGTDSAPATMLEVEGGIQLGNGGEACDSNTAGAMRYNSTTQRMEFCNAATWVGVQANGIPKGGGHFVMVDTRVNGCLGTSITGFSGDGATATATTQYKHYLDVGDTITVNGAVNTDYNVTTTVISTPTTTSFTYASIGTGSDTGQFCRGSGGFTAANDFCLNALTQNTSWRGYTSASSDGILNSTKVKAFLCDGSTCQQPSVTDAWYYFSLLGMPDIGGNSFQVTVSNAGPGNTHTWAATGYFGNYPSTGTSSWHGGRPSGSNDAWSTTAGSVDHCSGMTTNSSGVMGTVGIVYNTTTARWRFSIEHTCDARNGLICFVDP